LCLHDTSFQAHRPVLGVIVLSVLAVVLAPANAPAPDAPDRNVPSATTGPGRNAID
jgi:hypothetical protein